MVIEFVFAGAILCMIAYVFVRSNRERGTNAPLRAGIESRVCFATPLSRVRVLGTGGVRGTPGVWISLRGQKQLTVGTDAFMVSASEARHDYAFTGRESSIALSQAPSRLVNRDWIVITGPDRGRRVQLAIRRDNLPEIWQALASTGVAQR